MQRKASSINLSDGDDWDSYNDGGGGLVTKSVDVVPENVKEDESLAWTDEKESEPSKKKEEKEENDDDEGDTTHDPFETGHAVGLYNSKLASSPAKKDKKTSKPSSIASDDDEEPDEKEEEEKEEEKPPVKTKPRSTSEPPKPVKREVKKKEESSEEEEEEEETPKPKKANAAVDKDSPKALSAKFSGSMSHKEGTEVKAPLKKPSAPTKEKEKEKKPDEEEKPKKTAPPVTIADFPRSRMMVSNHKFNREEQRFARTTDPSPEVRLAFDIVDDLTSPLTDLIAHVATKSKEKGYSATEEVDFNKMLEAKKGSTPRTVVVACFKVLKQHLEGLKERAPGLLKLGANLAAVTRHYLAKSDVTEYDAVTKNLLKWAERAAVDRPVAVVIGDTSGVALKSYSGLDPTLLDLAPSEAVDRIKTAVRSRKLPRISDKKIAEYLQEVNCDPIVIDNTPDDDEEDVTIVDPAARLGPLSTGKLLVASVEAEFGKKLDKTSREMEKAKKLAAKVKLPPLTVEEFWLAHRGLIKEWSPETEDFAKASRARALVLRHLVNAYLDFKKNVGEASEERKPSSSGSKADRGKSSNGKGGSGKSSKGHFSSEEEASDREEGSMDVDEEEAQHNAREHKSNKVSGSRSGKEKSSRSSSSPPPSGSKKRKRQDSDEEKGNDDDDEDIASRFKAKKVKKGESDEE